MSNTAVDHPSTDLAPNPVATVRSLLQQSLPNLKAALPRHIQAEYMIRVVLTSVQRTPDLQKCHPITLVGAVFQAAQLGLVPDGVLGEAYLVPFWNSKKSRHDVQFIPGYKGLIALARRSGEVSTIDAEVVHEKDRFVYRRGTTPVLEHEPSDADDPGPMTKVWAIMRLKDGGVQVKVMNRREVMKIRARSAAVRAKRSSPWETDEEWMWRKTCLKQLCKLGPASTELRTALMLDDRAEAELPQDLALLADEAETPTPDPDEATADDQPTPPKRASEVAGEPPPLIVKAVQPTKVAGATAFEVTLSDGRVCVVSDPAVAAALRTRRDEKTPIEVTLAGTPSSPLPTLLEFRIAKIAKTDTASKAEPADATTRRAD